MLEYKVTGLPRVDEIINDMAILTASAHIRSSGWKGAAVVDELSAFGENKQWQTSVLDFGKTYSLTVKKDYQAFCIQMKKIKQSSGLKHEA